MLYGLYQAAQGANVQARRMEVISNNLANVNTTSFKRDLAIFQARDLEEHDAGGLTDVPRNLQKHPGMIDLAEVATLFSNGSHEPTGGALDVAFQGDGFLRVSDGKETFLSRSGKMSIAPDRQVVQANTGYPVLQNNNLPIVVPEESHSLEIAEDGTMSAINSLGIRATLGQIHLVQTADLNSLEKTGDSLYRMAGESSKLADAGDAVRLRQGFLEASTVEPIQEMTQMIETSRALEANMNMIQQQEQSLGQLLQSMSQ